MKWILNRKLKVLNKELKRLNDLLEFGEYDMNLSDFTALLTATATKASTAAEAVATYVSVHGAQDFTALGAQVTTISTALDAINTSLASTPTPPASVGG